MLHLASAPRSPCPQQVGPGLEVPVSKPGGEGRPLEK